MPDGDSIALDFPLTVVFPVGTLEAMPVALLQEILAPVGQQACKPTHLRHLPNLKLSPKENIAPGQPPECFMACSKRYSSREERLLSWANWDSCSVSLSVLSVARTVCWVCVQRSLTENPHGLCTVVEGLSCLLTLGKCCPSSPCVPSPSCHALRSTLPSSLLAYPFILPDTLSPFPFAFLPSPVSF